MIKNYLEEVNEKTKNYYKILSKDFPEFLNDYIYTKEMQRLDGINQICGAYWRNLKVFDNVYSVLMHSVAVALIIWNFTHDKKQTIAGLLHDITSPAFKHLIEFLKGDAEKQETLDGETGEFIKNSQEIVELLKRDGIEIGEVSDYKIYPIADNETPKLSADRLEYTFMNGVYYNSIWDLSDIKEMYDDIVILKNEEEIDELGFSSIEMTEKFVNGASTLWPLWVRSMDTITMYFFIDIIQKVLDENNMDKEVLYSLSEKQIIDLILNCKNKEISNLFNKFLECDKIIECDEFRKDKFCVSRKVKRRYINPLTTSGRASSVSKKAKEKIDEYLNMKMTKFAYIDI